MNNDNILIIRIEKKKFIKSIHFSFYSIYFHRLEDFLFKIVYPLMSDDTH